MNHILVLKDKLENLTDPRVLGRTKHNLVDIVLTTCVAIICGAQSWYDIEDFAIAKREWLQKYLSFENGIPSHDTFLRIFSLIDSEELEDIFISWVNTIRKTRGQVLLSLDGKTVRGTVKKELGRKKGCLHLVSLWSTYEGLVLGQIKATEAGNPEVTAAKKLIKKFNLKDTFILGDAGIGRPGLAEELLEKKANYLFPVKGNSKGLHERIINRFSEIDRKSDYSQTESGHGREELREVWVISKVKEVEQLNIPPKSLKREEYFPGARSFAMIKYTRTELEGRPYDVSWEDKRTIKLKNTTEENKYRKREYVRYFVCSEMLKAEDFLEKVRLHWHIENKLHWCLDVTLGEDGSRERNKVAARNLSVMRKIALNLARQVEGKISLRRKLKQASYDNEKLEKLLFGKA